MVPTVSWIFLVLLLGSLPEGCVSEIVDGDPEFERALDLDDICSAGEGDEGGCALGLRQLRGGVEIAGVSLAVEGTAGERSEAMEESVQRSALAEKEDAKSYYDQYKVAQTADWYRHHGGGWGYYGHHHHHGHHYHHGHHHHYWLAQRDIAPSFEEVDTNTDGEIKDKELASLLNQAKHEDRERLTELFQSHDEDGSNSLSKEEFEKAVGAADWYHYRGGGWGRRRYGYGHRYGYGRRWGGYGYRRHWLGQQSAAPEFEVSDTNGDGEVDGHELASLLEKAGKEDREGLTELFQSHDEDGSKGLSREEYEKAVEAADWYPYPGGGWGGYHHHHWHGGPGGYHHHHYHHYHHWLAQQNATAKFEDVDANGDGEVQSGELVNLLVRAAEKDREGLTELFESHDEDGSKGLSREEYEKAVEAADWYPYHGGGWGGHHHHHWHGGPGGYHHHHYHHHHHWLAQQNATAKFEDAERDAKQDRQASRSEP